MKNLVSGLKPTGRTFIVEYKGKKYKRKEYRREFVIDPVFRINGVYLHIPEKFITEVDNDV